MLKSYDLKLIRKEYSETTASIRQIAKRHGINYNTLKSYVYRHQWQEHTRITQYLDRLYNPTDYHDLTEEQLTFIYLMVYYDYAPVEAYRGAYNSKHETARVNSYRLLRRADVKEELARQLDNRRQGADEPQEPFNMVASNAFFNAYLVDQRKEKEASRRALFERLGI